MDQGQGIVYLVGAGPGDGRLATLRAVECIEVGDVVVYDRLVPQQLLSRVRPDAELIYAGKESSSHTLTQDEINAVLIARARAGKKVVRLKGGDPFVFGRGGEEALALVAEGIDYEVVPGVSSAVAAPAYAGIPVTHRSFSSSVAIVTGHEEAGRQASRIDWEGLGRSADTLVVLMGMEGLEAIVSKLASSGKSPGTPIALVRWGTRAGQETLVGTLGSIVSSAETSGFGAPAVIVVGNVVKLRDKLAWFEKKPLFGKRVLVTRAREQASVLSRMIAEAGGEPYEFPAIRIRPPEDWGPLDKTLGGIASYDWMFFTSTNGVSFTMDRLGVLGLDVRRLHAVKIGAIGAATADALAERGIKADFVPGEFTSEAMAREFPEAEVQGRKFLLPRAREASEILVQTLLERGGLVDEVEAYRTDSGDQNLSGELVELLREGRIHIATFTSSSTVRNLVRALDPGRRPETTPGPAPAWIKVLFDGVLVACIGPVTAEAARDLGLRVDVVAGEHTVPGLLKAVTEAVSGERVSPAAPG
ncbi:MAG: uroporphyrinogen-III C-methyltransferase [Firmicutes bacterium]|nr:uroporphyrinogen-III C-methyltransferase [Bacillota bacterium]